MLSANKGEWSEFYAFLKILSDKRLFSADETLALIPDSFLKVLSVIRHEGKTKIVYAIDEGEDKVVIKSGDEILAIVSIFQISGKLANLLRRIKEGGVSQGAFTISEAQDVMEELRCQTIKSSSSKKADISLEIEDPRTGTKPIRDFSIKSKLGGNPTLLNASRRTNFEFEIIHRDNTHPLPEKKPLINLDRILGENDDLKFTGILDKNFRKNLMMIDSGMPEIIAEMVKAFYLHIQSTVEGLASYIEKKDPLDLRNNEHFYKYKIRELLVDVALGMQPTKLWNGDDETHGGYIVVKKNGELACYHIYDRAKFGKYLFTNTKFETGGRSRHDFGKIYERDGRKFIKLNLQIRFTS